jgi:uncharacterized DUF497 family protein
VHPANAVGFAWDDENEEHLARHGITPEQAEQVFLNGPVWVRNKANQRGVWKMVGWDDDGRTCTIIVNVREDQATLHVVTGYTATAGDVTRYLSKRRRAR